MVVGPVAKQPQLHEVSAYSPRIGCSIPQAARRGQQLRCLARVVYSIMRIRARNAALPAAAPRPPANLRKYRSLYGYSRYLDLRLDSRCGIFRGGIDGETGLVFARGASTHTCDHPIETTNGRGTAVERPPDCLKDSAALSHVSPVQPDFEEDRRPAGFCQEQTLVLT